jgi:GNAT superfamily N-acetyltransferase
MKAEIINIECPVRYDAAINQITSTRPPRTIRTKSSRTRYHTIRCYRSLSGLRFRLAQPADLSELARLRMEHVGLDSTDTCQAKADFCRSFEEFLVRRITTGEWLVLVAETNGQLVGCVYLQKIAKLPRPGYLKRAYGCITYLFVHKHYRGQGLRRQLLREIVQVAQSEGLEYLTGRPEAESHSVYRLHGFKQIDPEMKLALK